MNQTEIPKPVAKRLPLYLHYLKSLSEAEGDTISSAAIARALQLGEVQVRKDLALISGAGRPKIGYRRRELTEHIARALGVSDTAKGAVVVGMGRLGSALLSYPGFAEYGLSIQAAFDNDPLKMGKTEAGIPVLPVDTLSGYCRDNDIRIGIITVPEPSAREVYATLAGCGIQAVWNFAPCRLEPTEGVAVRNENMAASLAVLCADVT